MMSYNPEEDDSRTTEEEEEADDDDYGHYSSKYLSPDQVFGTANCAKCNQSPAAQYRLANIKRRKSNTEEEDSNNDDGTSDSDDDASAEENSLSQTALESKKKVESDSKILSAPSSSSRSKPVVKKVESTNPSTTMSKFQAPFPEYNPVTTSASWFQPKGPVTKQDPTKIGAGDAKKKEIVVDGESDTESVVEFIRETKMQDSTVDVDDDEVQIIEVVSKEAQMKKLKYGS